MVENKIWYVYLLWNPRLKRTYVGSTTDPKRRLRQHNLELVGGARSTFQGAPDWQFKALLSPFENRSVACRWEKLIKLRSKGLENRDRVFKALSKGICPPGRYYKVPDNLIYEEFNV